MAVGRYRVKGGKGTRWRKGQSGGSNPTVTKHRKAARGRLGNHLCRGSSDSQFPLTTEALTTHDMQQDDNPCWSADTVTETGSITRSSLATGSSVYGLIDSAHPIFGKVKRLWKSRLESHKKVCAVLAAVSELIQDKGGKGTTVEYFAALLTGLRSATDVESATAIAYLLSVVIERVPESVLQTQFSAVCKDLCSVLSAYQAHGSTSLLKSLLGCLATLLSAQPCSVWSESYTQTMLLTLLNFTICPKPKLRKAVQKSIVSMLKEGGTSTNENDSQSAELTFSPVCAQVVKFSVRTIEKGGLEAPPLHVVGMLKECIANFPVKHIKTLCELVLKLVTLGNSIVKSTGMQCLHGLFSSHVGPQGLTAKLNGQIISALYDHQPHIADVQLLLAWITVMESAHIRLHSLDHVLALSHLAKFFSVCMSCLLAESSIVTRRTTDVMKNLLVECVPSAVALISASQEKGPGKCPPQGNSDISSMFSIVELGLGYKYCSAWDLVMTILETFYLIAGKHCHKFMTKSLRTLSELRSTPNFPCVAELEDAFGAAFQAMGPRVVLKAVPLKLDIDSENPNLSRSWLLPLMKERVQKTELNYFTEQLVPMAEKIRKAAQTWMAKGRDAEAATMETLEEQVWSLLPAFCTDPNDLQSAFRSIFPTLCSALETRPDLRPTICRALTLLIEGSKSKDQECKELAQFAGTFLDILCSVYTKLVAEGNEGSCASMLACIGACLSIANNKIVRTSFAGILSQLCSSDVPSHVMDMAEVFVPWLPTQTVEEVFQLLSPMLDRSDFTVQKKAYKLLGTMLSATSNRDHSTFISDHLSDLKDLLLGSLSTAGAASKKPRLKCLLKLVEALNADCKDFLTTITPEVILCTKEVNEKCRLFAFQLLVAMGNAAQRCSDKNAEQSLREFFVEVLAGLAGSSRMVAATIGCLSRLVFEFHDLLGTELVKQLLSSTNVFLSARSREVVKATLDFMKVLIGVLSPMDLSPHVEELVKSVLSWGEDSRNHFRLKSRVILERLVRKFSLEMIAEMVPDKHKKLISHIRKTNERRKRQRRAKLVDSVVDDLTDVPAVTKRSKLSMEELLWDSSDDEEDTNPPHVKKAMVNASTNIKGKKKQKHGSAWLQEGSEDDPINFLDPAATRRVLTTDPCQAKRKRKSEQEFAMDSEGKLIITGDDHDGKESLKKLPVEESMDVDDENKGEKRSRRKRKFHVMEVDESDEENEGSKSGISWGSGIYRKNCDNKDYGTEYRAKKAKGDVRRPGKPDPYAYIQLDRQKLNHRKRAKLSGQFKGIMAQAQKGSYTGKKQLRKRFRR